jgi:hypothetical protein
MSDSEDVHRLIMHSSLNLFLCRNWVLMLTCMLWCLENLFWMMRSVFNCLQFTSQHLYLWLTCMYPCLERTDGNFSLQVCLWLWADAYFFKTIFLLTYVLLFRTMSSVRSHAAGGENFFMMILQFLETFVGSMSSGCTFGPHSAVAWF